MGPASSPFLPSIQSGRQKPTVLSLLSSVPVSGVKLEVQSAVWAGSLDARKLEKGGHPFPRAISRFAAVILPHEEAL